MNALITHSSVVCATPRRLLIPRVSFRNLFREGTVTASSQNAAHPVHLAFDGLTYDAWLTTGAETEWIAVASDEAQAADCMALGVHTLEGATLTPQSSDDGMAWTNLADPLVAPDDRPIIWEFDSVEALNYRLLIENAEGPVSLGAIHVGEKLELASGLPANFMPPSLNERVDYSNTGSEGGQSLGRSVLRRGVQADVQAHQVGYEWAREDWEEFIASAEIYAFFFWWAHAGKAEIVYGALSSKDAHFSSPGRLIAHFQVQGIN